MSEIDRDCDGVPTDPVLRGAYHLINVWDQYSKPPPRSRDGMLCLEHRNMTAGEAACDFLESLGLAKDQGYEIALTRKGLDLIQEPDRDLRGCDEV